MGWLLLGILVYFLIVFAERALIAVSPHDIEQLPSPANSGEQRLRKILDDIKPTLAALLLARLFIKVLAVVFSVFATVRFFYWVEVWLDGSPLVGLTKWALLAAVVLLLATVFWAIKNWKFFRGGKSLQAIQWVKRFAPFIAFWKALFSPFVKGKENTSGEANLKKNANENGRRWNETTTSGNSQPTAANREMEMLKSIVKFSDVTVKQVMQPRSKVVALDFKASFSELLKTVNESGFSRMPIFDEDLDNVTGILYVKDLVPHLNEGEGFEWQSLIRPHVMMVPETKRISELLADFKSQKTHMAIVVDEYGGIEGLVTMEDVLEEVTGDIQDEFDEDDEVHFTKLDSQNYLFEGRTLINDVCRITGIDQNTFEEIRDDSDTLAGLVLELSGDIPKIGTEVGWQGFNLTVTAANNRRIEQVKLTLPGNPAPGKN